MDTRTSREYTSGETNGSARHPGRSTLVLWAAAACLAAVANIGAQEPDSSTIPDHATRVTVHGMVRNASTGEPLARALVQIEGDAATGALTDNEGQFEISGVPIGPQLFGVLKPGFHDRTYATEEAALQAVGPAHSVLVAAQMPEINFALLPNCAIRGRIELSTGDPAEGLSIGLLRQGIQFGRAVWMQIANTSTNGDGTYRFGGLPDGIYVVFTEPTLESEPAAVMVAAGSAGNVSRSGFAGVFYPDAHDLASAGLIRLSNGGQAEANIRLNLEPFYPVTAVAVPPGGQSNMGRLEQPGDYTAVLMDTSGNQLNYAVENDSATRTVQTNLPNGTYALLVRGLKHTSPISSSAVELRSGGAFADSLAGIAEFTVAGHALSGLRVPLSTTSPAVVHLRVMHSADSPGLAVASNMVNISLDQAGGVPSKYGGSNLSMENGPDAISFSANPGSYWLSTFVDRKGLCIGSMTAGSVNLAREPLLLSLAAPPPPMDLTLRDDCGTLALNLPPALASFLPGEEPYYTVYVVADFETLQQIAPMTMHPSSGPTLTLDSLTPGSYHVYVFDSPVHLEYRNAAAMAALPNPGQQVTVSGGTTTNLVLEAPEH